MEINFKKCITYKVFVKLLNVMSTLANLRREGVLNDTPMVEMMNFDKNSPLNVLPGIALRFEAEIIDH